jgi:hypothetical protein
MHGTITAPRTLSVQQPTEDKMKGILAWLIGIPIPLIILLYLFDVF